MDNKIKGDKLYTVNIKLLKDINKIISNNKNIKSKLIDAYYSNILYRSILDSIFEDYIDLILNIEYEYEYDKLILKLLKNSFIY